jgi:hypothetical protein
MVLLVGEIFNIGTGELATLLQGLPANDTYAKGKLYHGLMFVRRPGQAPLYVMEVVTSDTSAHVLADIFREAKQQEMNRYSKPVTVKVFVVDASKAILNGIIDAYAGMSGDSATQRYMHLRMYSILHSELPINGGTLVDQMKDCPQISWCYYHESKAIDDHIRLNLVCGSAFRNPFRKAAEFAYKSVSNLTQSIL